jgi:hypothetical protein
VNGPELDVAVYQYYKTKFIVYTNI